MAVTLPSLLWLPWKHDRDESWGWPPSLIAAAFLLAEWEISYVSAPNDVAASERVETADNAITDESWGDLPALVAFGMSTTKYKNPYVKPCV